LAEQSEAGANFRAAAAQEGANNRAAAGRRGKDTLVQKYYDDITQAQQTTDPRLKAALLARARDSKKAIAELEQTESSFLANEARLAAKREENDAIMNRGDAGDGFYSLEGQ
jgi:hypothetical protein